jgi:hypothetical protein
MPAASPVHQLPVHYRGGPRSTLPGWDSGHDYHDINGTQTGHRTGSSIYRYHSYRGDIAVFEHIALHETRLRFIQGGSLSNSW